jgi:Insertion element 4 transposase N-terminal
MRRARELRSRTLSARVVVCYLLAMVLFFQCGYSEVWSKQVAGLDWARPVPGPGGAGAERAAAVLPGEQAQAVTVQRRTGRSPGS